MIPFFGVEILLQVALNHELGSFSCPRRRFYSLLREAPIMKIWSKLESHPAVHRERGARRMRGVIVCQRAVRMVVCACVRPLCVALPCCHHVHPLVDPHDPLVLRRQNPLVVPKHSRWLAEFQMSINADWSQFNRCVTHI